MSTIINKLDAIKERYDALSERMSQPEVISDPAQLQRYAREQASLEPLVEKYRAYQQVTRQLAETEEMLGDGLDEEMKALVREELTSLREREAQLLQDIRASLIPKDPNDEKDVIVEVRAGTGGEEAALFAGDLFRMYSRYAERHGWQTEVLDASPTELGGFKEIIFEIHGRGAYSRLKYDSGVHR
ncbi:MAG: PCRF domain-containing protein, partial [Chloroflexi bacterium]|nr:PCRF domain-containing protein [Chloroflexota bacterium]